LTEAEKQNDLKVAQDRAVEDKKVMQAAERKGKKIQESELDDEMKQIRRIELQYEREQLDKEINTLINDFDDEIKEM